MLTCLVGLSLLLLDATQVLLPPPVSLTLVPAAAANGTPADTVAAPQGSDFAFDLLPPEAPTGASRAAFDPTLAQAVAKRRFMLQTHQILGLTTLGLMAATVVLGQFNYNDLYTQGTRHTGNFLMPHRIGAYSTTAAFITTASFSLFAPTPYAKTSQGMDTATIHKVSVGVASVGMVAQIVLGFITARSADAGNTEHLADWAKTHQIIGYTTLGAMTTAAAVWLF